MNIKKLLAGAAASALVLGSMATAVIAAPPSYGEQPGYSQASACGADHGAFAYFGNFGYVDNVHDVDGSGLGYDEYADGTDDNVGQGAEGGVTGGTGDRNSNSCGNPQHDF